MNTESLMELINNVGNNNDDEEDNTNDIRMMITIITTIQYIIKADTFTNLQINNNYDNHNKNTQYKIALVYELHLFSFQKVSKAFNCKFSHLRLRVMKTQD